MELKFFKLFIYFPDDDCGADVDDDNTRLMMMMMLVVVVMMMVNVAKRLECGWEGVINCTSKPETVRT